jgi:hypothetical protein
MWSTGMFEVPEIPGGHLWEGAALPGMVLSGEDVEGGSSLGVFANVSPEEVAHA